VAFVPSAGAGGKQKKGKGKAKKKEGGKGEKGVRDADLHLSSRRG